MAENFIDVQLITTILAPRVQRQGNTYIVVNENGTVRTNSAGENLTLAEAVAQEAANRPYLVRGQVKSGGGGSSSIAHAIMPEDNNLQRIFGKHSDSSYANALCLRDPRKYAQLKIAAKNAGLI